MIRLTERISRFTDWIWHIRGSLPLAVDQSNEEAFDRLDPLFRQTGTSHERTSDTLTFRKRDSDAQDKMAIFDRGTLEIKRDASGSALHYRLTSRALLCCFLAPLLFLGFAQLTIYIGKLEKASTEAAGKPKKPEKKKPERQLHPIDKALGAPAPDKPKKDKPEDEDDGHSPTPSYVFAGIFAGLYVVGRLLEAWLAKSLFRKRLLDA